MLIFSQRTSFLSFKVLENQKESSHHLKSDFSVRIHFRSINSSFEFSWLEEMLCPRPPCSEAHCWILWLSSSFFIGFKGFQEHFYLKQRFMMLVVKNCLSKCLVLHSQNPEVLSFRFSLVKDFAMPKVAPLGQLGILPDKPVNGRRGEACVALQIHRLFGGISMDHRCMGPFQPSEDTRPYETSMRHQVTRWLRNYKYDMADQQDAAQIVKGVFAAWIGSIEPQIYERYDIHIEARCQLSTRLD